MTNSSAPKEAETVRCRGCGRVLTPRPDHNAIRALWICGSWTCDQGDRAQKQMWMTEYLATGARPQMIPKEAEGLDNARCIRLVHDAAAKYAHDLPADAPAKRMILYAVDRCAALRAVPDSQKLLARIAAAADELTQEQEGWEAEAYHQLHEAMREAGFDDLPGGPFGHYRRTRVPDSQNETEGAADVVREHEPESMASPTSAYPPDSDSASPLPVRDEVAMGPEIVGYGIEAGVGNGKREVLRFYDLDEKKYADEDVKGWTEESGACVVALGIVRRAPPGATPRAETRCLECGGPRASVFHDRADGCHPFVAPRDETEKETT